MTAPIASAAQRAAQVALEEARPIVGRLDASRHPEELAADLIEAWAAVETSLRALIGGSTLSGQALIRDSRARQIITFDQANGLAQFHAARERADRTDYHPTGADVAAARDGFFKLHTVLQQHAAALEMIPPGMATPLYTDAMRVQGLPLPGSPGAASGAPVAATDMTPALAAANKTRRSRPRWLVPLLAALVLIAVLGGGWALLRARAGSDTLQSAITLYQQGQRERANAEFTRAARENPGDATPHVYLSRMARDVGNLAVARDEAVLAVRADSLNPLAHREMASVMFTMGNYDSARRFYTRAITLDPADRSSMGYLGCALARLGRFDDARRFLDRAGPGDWQACARGLPPPGTPNAGPGQMPPPGQAMPQPPTQGQPGQPPEGQYIPRPS